VYKVSRPLNGFDAIDGETEVLVAMSSTVWRRGRGSRDPRDGLTNLTAVAAAMNNPAQNFTSDHEFTSSSLGHRSSSISRQ